MRRVMLGQIQLKFSDALSYGKGRREWQSNHL